MRRLEPFVGVWTLIEAVEGPLPARAYDWSDFSSESFALRVSLAAGQRRWRTYRRKGRATS